MRSLLILAVACASLTACTTTSIDAAIQKNLPKTCALIETAHAAFSVVAESGDLSSRTVRREAAAYEGISVLCSDPSQATTADAIVKIAQAYAVISLAMKEAKAAE